MKRNRIILLIMVAATAIVASCGNEYERKPGRIYAPDMTYSRAYEYYGQSEYTANGLVAQAPVAGTMARGGYAPYRIAEGDTNAAKANTCNIELKTADIEEGKRLYAIHCGVCHGNALDGNGPLYNGGNGKFPAAPANFKDPKYLNMTVGTMYHAIMFGKNMMGAYSSQLDVKQRWMVLAYIKKFQSENGGAPFTQFKINDGASTPEVKKSEDLKPGEILNEVVVDKEAKEKTTQVMKVDEPKKEEAKNNPITDLKAATKK